jgi:hypothetical protein
LSQPTVQPGLTRYPIQLPLLYWRKTGPQTRARAGWTHELSDEGASVELADRVASETLLRIRIQSDRGSIEAEGQVVWFADPAPAGVENYHGLVFTQIAPDHLQTLRDLLLPLSMVAHAGMRLAVDLPATCKPKGLGGRPLQGRAGDVSRGGLLLRLPHALPLGTEMEIILHAGNGPITLEGAIVWADKSEEWKVGELIDHGVRFTSSTWSISLALGFLLGGLY